MASGLLEPLAQHTRISQVLPHFPPGGVFVDIGCGWPPKLIYRIHKKMDFCIGIDEHVKPMIKANYELKKCRLKKNIPVESDLAFVVTILAALEHFEYPHAILQECFRILKPGGMLLITVPRIQSKPILEILAQLKLIDSAMVKQHLHYFTKDELNDLCVQAGFKSVYVNTYLFGFNHIVRAIK